MSDFYDQRSKHRVGKVKAAVLVFDRVYFRGNGTERQENGVVVSVCYQRGFFEKTFLLSVRSAFFPAREVAYIKIGVQISRFQRKLALSVRDTEVKRGRNQVEGEIFQILRVDDCFELCVDVERPRNFHVRAQAVVLNQRHKGVHKHSGNGFRVGSVGYACREVRLEKASFGD